MSKREILQQPIENLIVPETEDVLLWQETMSCLVGKPQFERWQRETWEKAPNARPLNDKDRKIINVFGVGSFQISKFTPTIKDFNPLITVGGWCTFSEGDTKDIYQGKLPNGEAITKPRDLLEFLKGQGDRFEQVIRCIGPMGISQNQPIPYFVVVEDSLWARKIAASLGKPEWEQELQRGFMAQAKETSEGLIQKWLSLTTGVKRGDVFFFYTSEMEEILVEAIEQFANFIPYKGVKDYLQKMPVLVMYTGFWPEALKKIYQFRNAYGVKTVSKNSEAVICEVETHFRMRGEEDKIAGSFYWNNTPGDKNDRNNPNRNIHMAGFYQQRVPNQNKRLEHAYLLPANKVLNIGNRRQFVQDLAAGVEQSERIYPLCNSVCLEAMATLYWLPEARSLLKLLTLLPKDGLITAPESGKAIDAKFTYDAKEILKKLVDYLNDAYQLVGYK